MYEMATKVSCLAFLNLAYKHRKRARERDLEKCSQDKMVVSQGTVALT